MRLTTPGRPRTALGGRATRWSGPPAGDRSTAVRSPSTPVADGLATEIDPAPSAERLRDWDEMVRNVPETDVTQLSAWARLRARAGFEALYVFVTEAGQLVGGAQVLIRRVPVLGAIGYLPYGPVVSPTTDRTAAVQEALADALDTVGREVTRVLFVQPPVGGDPVSTGLLQRGFRPSDAGIAPPATLHIDLTADETQLRRNLSRRLQRWTDQWESRGVSVRPAQEVDLPVVARLHAATAEHQGFEPYPLDYLTAMYQELSPGGHLLILVAEVGGRPGAMQVHTSCGGVLRTRLFGLDRTGEGARLNIGAAIDWTAIRWGKQTGHSSLDLMGVSPQTLAALEEPGGIDHGALRGPDAYKLRLGATPFRLPLAVELISPPVLRGGYDLVRRSTAGRRVLGQVQRMVRLGTGRGRDRRRGASSTTPGT